jgi:hypothetical protein
VRGTTVHKTSIALWIPIAIHSVLLSFFFNFCCDFFSNLFLSILSFKIEIVKNLAL